MAEQEHLSGFEPMAGRDFDADGNVWPGSPLDRHLEANDSCKRCGGTGTVNLGIRSDPEYHPCPDCKSHDSGTDRDELG